MYVGFNLDINGHNFTPTNNTNGLIIYENYKKRVHQQLDTIISTDGNIDGTKMREDWFPSVDADIFISHSHSDEEQAIKLAGWLKEELGLTAFIDSCVWGYAGDLLKKIDDEYCWNEHSKMYDYAKRNYSTSHVYMMLSSALTMMIDKTECVFFLNTPASIKLSEVSSKTLSPWIYHELTMTQLIQKKSPVLHRKDLEKAVFKHASESAQLNITYDVDLSNLIDLTDKDLRAWSNNKRASEIKAFLQSKANIHPLDLLYGQKQIINEPVGGSILG